MLEISVYCDDISNVTGFQIGLLSRNNVVHMKQSKKNWPKAPTSKTVWFINNQDYLPPLSGISLGEISSIVLK